ncbi:MAG: zinc metallopeptidase [Chloroflexota bacterium]|nr:zinc metallopeptidase [Chloroflexota bacterium]
MWDPMYWVFAAPALILALVAQWWVRHAYQKYLDVRNSAGVTGLEAARHMMRGVGLGVKVETAEGTLSDHYDPRSKVLRLSQEVANRPSVASVAIVAHELGHAEQDAQGYTPMRIRSGLVPVVNFTSWLGPILFIAGLWLSIRPIAWVGVMAFGAAAVFALVTLPVELNASRRGLRLLEQSAILTSRTEKKQAKRVLSAAALTYVAALAQAISTLLYYVFLLGGGRRRD